MKRYPQFSTLIAFSATVLTLVAVPPIQSAPLLPGQVVPSVAEPDPLGGGLVASLVVPFASTSFSGTLTSQVIGGDLSNPFGGLTFTYRVDLFAGSPQAMSQLTVSSYDSFRTDVSFNPLGGGVAPTLFSRSSEGGPVGEVVRFHFLSPAVAGGQFSALLVVQTDAPLYQRSAAGLIDGQTVNVDSLAPLAIPEPAAVALLLAGFGVLCFSRRH